MWSLSSNQRSITNNHRSASLAQWESPLSHLSWAREAREAVKSARLARSERGVIGGVREAREAVKSSERVRSVWERPWLITGYWSHREAREANLWNQYIGLSCTDWPLLHRLASFARSASFAHGLSHTDQPLLHRSHDSVQERSICSEINNQ